MECTSFVSSLIEQLAVANYRKQTDITVEDTEFETITLHSLIWHYFVILSKAVSCEVFDDVIDEFK